MNAGDELQQLWADHRVCAHLLRVFTAQLPAALSGDRIALGVMRDIVAREREYGDFVHHAREELMFGRMAARSASGAEAVQGLVREHEDIARKGTTVLESLEACLAGRAEDPQLLRQRVEDYVDGLVNHMHKEEQRVFALAPQVLIAEDWRLVGAAFAGRTDPLAPPTTPAYQSLSAWLSSHGEMLY